MRRIYEKLPGALLPWYDEKKRELPWRQDRKPYHIWLSEIMLQQTRVEAVKGYYDRFLERLPTVADLAKADDELLHKLWEGLGYYSRVRNLKKAAQMIMEQYGGVFPGDYETVLTLPGIGEYTAGAISSIAFNQKKAAVDGNVMRVISRLTNDSTPIDQPAYKKQVKVQLETVYPDRAGDFTQALMELGATVCGPNRKPDCERCPCSGFCCGYQHGTAAVLPVKQPKRQRKTEERTVLILTCDSYVGLRKRPDRGLLAGMWEFPNISGKLDTPQVIRYVEEIGLKPREIIMRVEKKHIFTHIEWNMSGIYIEVAEPCGDLVWVSGRKLREATALPTAFRQFWEGISCV